MNESDCNLTVTVLAVRFPPQIPHYGPLPLLKGLLPLLKSELTAIRNWGHGLVNPHRGNVAP